MTEPDPNPYTMLEAKIKGLHNQVDALYDRLSKVDDQTPLEYNGILAPVILNLYHALHHLDLAGDRARDLGIEETKRREIVTTAIEFIEEAGA